MKKRQKGESPAQIREQMSGSEISWYEKSILGCGLWAVVWAGL